MKAVDLHTHSTKSDGSMTPTELVNYAVEKGLAAIALSDHDTTDGIDEALAAAKGKDIEVIPAIEFSTEYDGRDIHIVGLYIDYHSQEFEKYLQDFRDARILRNQKMCKKLAEHGIDITYDELHAHYAGSVLTRAHYAAYLMEHGYVKSRSEAFDRYVGDYAPCFVPREKVTPMQAVELILKVGGIPILAHPILYHLSKPKLEKLIQDLKAVGLVGIEAIYSTYSTSEEALIRQLAKKYDLLLSGGSDFHGCNKPKLDLGTGYGKLFVPEEILTNLKAYRRENGRFCKKIIFSDMDGTLLDDKKNISDEIYRAIVSFTDQGGTFVLSSGRPVGSILETSHRLGLDFPNTYIISYNGALIYDVSAKKPLSEIRVPMEQVRQIMELAKEHHIHVHTYTDDAIISPADDKELAHYKIHVHLPSIISEDVTKALDKDPYKMLIIYLQDHISLPEENDELVAFKQVLDEHFGDTMHTFYSDPLYLECCMKEASKGNAIRRLCKYLDIDIKDSAAIGDADNDISMIEAAGHGICMINGSDGAKKAADHITAKDNNHDGFLEIFQYLQ